jgi:hypothetical protein
LSLNWKKAARSRIPFAHRYSSTAPIDYIRIEVQRSIDRIKLRLAYRRPPNVPKVSAADFRKLGRLLRKMGYSRLAAQLGASDHVTQEPPPRADPLKHYCADEAFCLMEWFSAKEATFSEGGPFQIIAEKLYEAVTGKHDVSLERACDWILQERRKVRQRPIPRADA